MNCGGSETFECKEKDIPLKWTITGLRDIDISGPFLARTEAHENSKGRISINDTGEKTRVGMSNLTISGFTVSDEGGIVKCVNMKDNSIIGMAHISICECVCVVYAMLCNDPWLI